MIDTRDSPSPFGMHAFIAWNHPWNRFHYNDERRAKALALLQEAHAAWVRLDFIRSDIEPEPGRYSFEKFDRIVADVHASGLKMLALLAYGPGGSRPWPEVTDPRRFAAFASAVVGRYKDQVRHWEVWNEPDHPMFWQPQDGLHGYAALLREAYAAIKAADPTSVVHAAGLSQGLPRSLKNLYQEAGRTTFDVVHVHPFVNPMMPDALGGLRYLLGTVWKVMTENGDSAKEIWLSQMGCPGAQHPDAVAPWWLGKNPSEAHQADWLRLVYSDVLTWPGVKKIFWSSLRDTNGFFGSGADHFGLVRYDFSRKPSFEAYQKAAQAPVPA